MKRDQFHKTLDDINDAMRKLNTRRVGLMREAQVLLAGKFCRSLTRPGDVYIVRLVYFSPSGSGELMIDGQPAERANDPSSMLAIGRVADFQFSEAKTEF